MSANEMKAVSDAVRELPESWEEWADKESAWTHDDTPPTVLRHCAKELRSAIGKQSANPVCETCCVHGLIGGHSGQTPGQYEETRGAVPRLLAASQSPTDDNLWDQTLKERDHYHDMADRLAACIARITGADIGEHTSANCPWHEAIGAADDFVPKAASQRVSENMPVEFGEWFGKNYPGPETIISDPHWHAPRIWRAARHAMLASAQSPEPMHIPVSRDEE